MTAFDYPAYIEEGLIDRVLERGPIWRDPAAAGTRQRAADVSSLQDVAALATVSTATVSRVLSGSSHPVAASTTRAGPRGRQERSTSSRTCWPAVSPGAGRRWRP